MAGSLYLLKNFNNYFNRKIILKDNLQDYLDLVGENGFYLLEETNFNPNDGVSTSHIVGDSAHPFEPQDNENEWNPDYALYVEEGIIKSRWFVLEFIRKKIGQYAMALKRDVIADKYELVITSPTYIEKAILDDTDPFIVNNEGISFNQIKQPEHYIKDETKVPWVVAYINQHERERKTIKSTFSSPVVLEIENCPEILELFPNITSATTDQEVHHKVFDDNNFKFYFRYRFEELAFPIIHSRRFQVNCSISPTNHSESLGQMWEPVTESEWDFCVNNKLPLGYVDDGWTKMGTGDTPRPLKDISNEMGLNFKNNFNTRVLAIYNAMGCTHHSTGYIGPDVSKYIGKIIHISATNKYFIFDIKDNGKSPFSTDGSLLRPELLNAFMSVSNRSGWGFYNESPVSRFHVGVNSQCTVDKLFRMRLNVASDVSLDLLGTKTGESPQAYQTQNVPYDVICFPAFTTTITKLDGTKQDAIGLAGINLARALSEQLGTDVLYDIQILPYCPARELIGTDGDIDIRLAGPNQVLEAKDNSNNIVTYCIFATTPFQNFSIDKLGTSIYNDDEINVADLLNVKDVKIESNTDLYRLSSPNYAASFDFNLAKCLARTGSYVSMSKFNIDIDFKPINPYIHIAPDFAFLYGSDYNDSRGLICSGDFGLTTLKNAWTDYTVRNKNYQNIFNRQISHMEVDRDIQRKMGVWDMVGSGSGAALAVGVGAIAGGVVGGAATFGVGGPVGALIGGGLAAATKAPQLASTIRKYQLGEEAYQESRAFTIDMFNMQMDNIKAMPNTITHSSALTNNFKFYPVLEFYTCTEKEKQALKNKIEYNGMTVGRIDRIDQYLSETEIRFVKGQIIRQEFLGEDCHLANEIFNEVNKGLFFNPYVPSNKEKKSWQKIMQK